MARVLVCRSGWRDKRKQSNRSRWENENIASAVVVGPITNMSNKVSVSVSHKTFNTPPSPPLPSAIEWDPTLNNVHAANAFVRQCERTNDVWICDVNTRPRDYLQGKRLFVSGFHDTVLLKKLFKAKWFTGTDTDIDFICRSRRTHTCDMSKFIALPCAARRLLKRFIQHLIIIIIVMDENIGGVYFLIMTCMRSNAFNVNQMKIYFDWMKFVI